MNNILINSKTSDQISVQDRAFQYGDGLFETIALRNGCLQYWKEHMQRLQQGCQLLGLEPVAEKTWQDDIRKLTEPTHNYVIKLIYSRGAGQRGYAIPEEIAPLWVTMVSPMPDYPVDYFQQGVELHVCRTPASINSRLAGLKHLNKLENVLARSEWSDSSIFEGLMLDDFGHVIEGTMSNVFAVSNNALYTPSLKRSGVNGVIRQRVIELAKNAGIITQQIDIKLEILLEMDEIFITNSIIGLCPVRQVDNKNFAVGPISRQLMEKLQQDINGCDI